MIAPAASYVGEGELARIVKICHNVFLGVVTQSLAEITVLAQKAGVPRHAFLEFMNQSVMGSTFSRYKTPAFVNLDFKVTFTPHLLRKDLDLGLDAARHFDVPMPLASITRDLVQTMIGHGMNDEDFAKLLLLQAEASGFDARAGERAGRRRPEPGSQAMSHGAALAGQVAWVTGGGSGIGLAGAIELAKAGWVIVSDAARPSWMPRSPPPRRAVRRPHRSRRHRSTSPMPPPWPASLPKCKHGRVDILVNSAGINLPKRHFRKSDRQLDQIVAINLNGLLPDAGGAAGDAAAPPGPRHQRRLLRRLLPRLPDRPSLHRQQGRR